MDWTTDNITFAVITFIIGTLLGYFICRMQLNGDSKAQQKQQELESELKQYKQDVEQHFAGSAELLNKMAADYSKIYQHMAQSQQSLLPDSEPAISPLFIESSAQAQSPEQAQQPQDIDITPAESADTSIDKEEQDQALEQSTAPTEEADVTEQPIATDEPAEPTIKEEEVEPQEADPVNQPNDYVAGSHGIINKQQEEKAATIKA